MAKISKSQKEKSLLKFEDFKGMKVSKPFKTPKGEFITLIFLSNHRLLIRGKKGDFQVQVIGPVKDILSNSIAKGFFSGLYDKVKGAVSDVINGVLGGGGGGNGCNQSTGDVTVNVQITGGSNNTITVQPNAIKVDVHCSDSPQ